MFSLSTKKKIFSGIITAVMIGVMSINTFACTSVLVGKKASTDGSVMIARNEDMSSAWAKHFVIRDSVKNKEGSVYQSKANKFTYKLPIETLKFTATPEWDESEGVFDEDGINEYQVAVSATESAQNNEKAQKADSFNKESGITEADITTIILQRAKTAKEGVKFLGSVIEEKGAGEAFGVAIADTDEAWYLECGSGHHWVAVRVPDDKYMVVANQLRIGEVDLKDEKNYLGSKDLVEFAEKNGLWEKEKVITSPGFKGFLEEEGLKDKKVIKNKFNFAKAYGKDDESDYKYNHPRVWWGEKMLTPSLEQRSDKGQYPLFLNPDKKINPSNVMSVLKSHYNGTENDPYNQNKNDTELRSISVNRTMESHVLQLRDNLPNPIGGIHWLALGVPDTSLYVPFYSGILNTPEEYKIGTDKYDEKSAYWNYRSVAAFTNANYKNISQLVKQEYKKLQEEYFEKTQEIDKRAAEIYNTDTNKALEYITEQCNKLAKKGLDKSKELKINLMTELTKLKNGMFDSNL